MNLSGIPGGKSPVPVSERIVASSKSNFKASFFFLPERKRYAIKTFYAFCRELDDGVDHAPDEEAALGSVRFWKEELEKIKGGGRLTPLGEEIDNLVHDFDLSIENFELIIEGVEADIEKKRYATFEELYHYCYCVASSVGFVCCEIAGVTGGSALRYAELTGVGVQLTNILRDVGEDARMGRIYLPAEDLDMFGVAEDDILRAEGGEKLLGLLYFEAARAEEFFKMGQGILSSIDAVRLYFCHLLSGTYMAVLRELKKKKFGLGSDKVTVTTREKLKMGAKTVLTSIFGMTPL